MGAEYWLFFIVFNYSGAKRIIELDPNAKVAYLNGDASPEQLKGDNITGLDYHNSILKKNPEWIEEAKRLGININVWTINKPEDMD
jgi:glycerophosphoryl diester phosphodiesterase